MLNACGTGKEYVYAHKLAFNEFADATWQSALRNVSPSLLWAIRLLLQREKVNPRDDDGRSDMQVVAELTGNALTRAASAPSLAWIWCCMQIRLSATGHGMPSTYTARG